MTGDPGYRFEILDHTADQAIAAYGKTLEETFEAAATAMFSLWVDLGRVRPERSWQVKVEGDSVENLLAHWLRELVYLAERDSSVFCRFNITSLQLDPWQIEGIAWGAPYSPEFRTGAVVKAVTKHALSVEPTADGWRATVTFDV